ncbi:MAG: DUF308 domain-containing protein [Clostridiales bacterium]|nr:DUF308 domain-containing protein [Clostridiales bacterium]
MGCKYCGRKISGAALYCYHCGKKNGVRRNNASYAEAWSRGVQIGAAYGATGENGGWDSFNQAHPEFAQRGGGVGYYQRHTAATRLPGKKAVRAVKISYNQSSTSGDYNISVVSVIIGIAAVILSLAAVFGVPYVNYAGAVIGVVGMVASVVERLKRYQYTILGFALGALAVMVGIIALFFNII